MATVCAAQEIPYGEAVIADLIRRHYIEKAAIPRLSPA